MIFYENRFYSKEPVFNRVFSMSHLSISELTSKVLSLAFVDVKTHIFTPRRASKSCFPLSTYVLLGRKPYLLVDSSFTQYRLGRNQR